MDTTETQKLITEYFENLYFRKLESLEEINKFLETYDLSNLAYEYISNSHQRKAQNQINSLLNSISPFKNTHQCSLRNSIK
jgi:hypothetical protein